MGVDIEDVQELRFEEAQMIFRLILKSSTAVDPSPKATMTASCEMPGYKAVQILSNCAFVDDEAVEMMRQHGYDHMAMACDMLAYKYGGNSA